MYSRYDVIVVGAGIMGSATAHSLIKQGKRVLLLEKFALPHSRGSSHGPTRITRKSYAQQYYACMMPEAFQKWEDLEKESGKTLFIKMGMTTICDKNMELCNQVQKALEQTNGSYELFDAEGIMKKYPQFSLSDDYIGILEHGGGILKAHAALTAFQNEFKRSGGILIDEVEISQIAPGHDVVLKTNKGKFIASGLVITAGAWTNEVLEKIDLHLPLKPIRTSPHYWKPIGNLKYDGDNFCCFIIKTPEGHEVYGLPAYEYGDLVKICLHTGPAIDPNHPDFNQPTWDTDFLKGFIKEKFNLLDPNPAVIERCMYTMTPDHDYILDSHPLWKNIVFGAGFSGHGFKTAPVVGKILGELVRGEKLSYDISPFKMSRFDKPLKSSL